MKSIIDIESRLDKNQARKLVSHILKGSGNQLRISKHAKHEMLKDNLVINDILNVLFVGKIFDNPEFENDSWRYRIQTQKIVVIFAFGKPMQIRVVTAWRKR